MAVKIKANIAYQPVVESISRKFVPRKETATAGYKAGPVIVANAGWMGGAKRTAGRAGLGTTSLNYLVIRTAGRTTPWTENEKNNHKVFKIVAVAVPELLMDLTQITRIQELYLEAQKDLNKTINGVSAYGYTYRGWVFAVQFAGRKESDSYNVSQFPASFDA